MKLNKIIKKRTQKKIVYDIIHILSVDFEYNMKLKNQHEIHLFINMSFITNKQYQTKLNMYE